MTPLSLRVRVLGYPPVTFGLLAGYAYIFWQWHGGQMPFLLALLAFFAGVKTVRAYDEKRAFQDWQREEEDAGDAHAPRMISLSGVMGILLALVVVYAATVNQAQLPEASIGARALRGVRWLALLYLAVAFVRLVVAWYRRRNQPQAAVVPAEPEPVFVSWMLDVPEYSPSRAEAERELPEYCARLLRR